jgi:hypothetical protein
MVGQVKVVAILMIVNGALVLLVGIALSVLGAAILVGVRQPQGAVVRPGEVAGVQIVSAVYIVLGLLVLTAGACNIMAGVGSLRFRGRGLALTALFFNIIPLITLWCAPTCLGVMIYGLIVMFNREVAEAFRLAAEGMPADEIMARAAGRGRRDYRHYAEEDDDDGGGYERRG